MTLEFVTGFISRIPAEELWLLFRVSVFTNGEKKIYHVQENKWEKNRNFQLYFARANKPNLASESL